LYLQIYFFSKACREEATVVGANVPAMERSPAEDQSLVLRDFLPYLLNRAGIKTGQSFAQDLQAFGLTLTDWRILIALSQADNQRLLELAEIVVTDVSTLSRQVAALQRAGLILRKRDRNDGRALRLALSAKARHLLLRTIPIARMHERVAVRGISDADLATLRRCTSIIYHNLQAFDAEADQDRVETALGI
jgi:DNA-binding MarR family transcriptional regulator